MGAANQYKVSIVVKGGKHPGAIINMDRPPQVGDRVKVEGLMFEILETDELMPATDDFGFVHATCRLL